MKGPINLAPTAIPKHFVPIVATLFVMLILWLSSVPLLSWYEFSAHHQELEDAAFKWHQQRKSDYSFELDIAGSVTMSFRLPIRIQVRDSNFFSAYQIDNDEEIDISGMTDVPDSIDSAFELAAGLLERRPYTVDIKYDALLHYPRRISVALSDSGDDSVTYYLSSLQTDYDR